MIVTASLRVSAVPGKYYPGTKRVLRGSEMETTTSLLTCSCRQKEAHTEDDTGKGRQSTPVTMSVCGVTDPPPARLSCSIDNGGGEGESSSPEQYESEQHRVNPAQSMRRICVKLPTHGCILAADSMVHFSFFFPQTPSF